MKEGGRPKFDIDLKQFFGKGAKSFMIHGLVFGAVKGDDVAQGAISILRSRGYPTISLQLWEEYNSVLVAFFTPTETGVQGRCLRCAAHEFYLREGVTLITPLVVACHSKALQKEERFERSVEHIAEKYLWWAMSGFSTNLNVFPPWEGAPTGQRPGHNSWRIRAFRDWKRGVEEYLSNLPSYSSASAEAEKR